MTKRNDLAIYDNSAENWWSDDVRWIRTLKNMVPGRMSWFDGWIDWNGKSVLDLGCAGGFMAEALAKRGAQVTGLDPAREAIGAARMHAVQEGLEIDYDVGNGETMSYCDWNFDAVICVDVLEHVADVEQVLRQVSRVLRPGCPFLFDTINRNAISRLAAITLAEDVLRILPKGTHDPKKFIRPGELAIMMKRAGLAPGPMTGLGPRGLDRRGDPVFGRVPTKSVIYMGIARKPGRAGYWSDR